MVADKRGDTVELQRAFMFRRPTLDINIDGVSIQVLNYTKKYIVLLNQKSAEFFQNRLQAYCDRCVDQSVHSLGSLPSPTDVATDMSGTYPISGFSFDNFVLNPHGPRTIKGVIWWCPKAFRWAIWIQKAKKGTVNHSAEEFCVNKSLTGDAYTEERDLLSIEATTAWNKLDCSKRPRIKLPDVAPSP